MRRFLNRRPGGSGDGEPALPGILPDPRVPDPLAPIPGAPIDEDLGHERAAKPVGTASRIGLGVIVLLALAGVFGGRGPLVQAAATAGPPARAPTEAPGETFTVRYDRFQRLDAPTVLEIQLPPADSSVTLSRALAEALRLDAVQPSPASETTAPDGGITLVGSPGETFRLHARPVHGGRLAGQLSLADGRAVALRTFVYP